jgi:hypothetical protein
MKIGCHYETKETALCAAREESVGGRLISLWIVGPSLYILEDYRRGDESREGFVEKIG